MKKFKSIQWKLMVPVTIVVIVISTLLGTYIYLTEKKARSAETEHFVNELIRARKLQLAGIISGLIEQAKLYGEKPEFRSNDDVALQNAIQSMKINNLIKELVVVRKDGTLISAEKKMVNVALKERDYYKAIFQDNAERYLYSIVSTINGEKLFGISLPIYNDSLERKAVLNVSINLENFCKMVTDSMNVLNGYAFVYDKDGKIIMHPNRDKVLKSNLNENNAGLKELYLKSQNSESGQQLFRDENKDYSCYYETIPDTPGWTLAFAIPVKEIQNPVVRLLRTVDLGFLFMVIVIIAMTGFINNRIIIKPLERLMKFVTDLSQGRLKSNVEIKNKDEVGKMTEELIRMREQFIKVITDISDTALLVKDMSNKMSSSAQQLSQSANEQASSVEELSSTMEEMVSNIERNTENIQETDKIARVASESMKHMEESERKGLDSIRNITDKISIINDIAFQTNLLALNAAVEAARAGDSGKGFSVVAAEVRKLAERSKIAADEIIQLSHESVRLTEKSGELIENLLPQIEKTTQLVQEVTSASIEQNSGASQVNTVIQQLNMVTQQYAASSEELASNSEEISQHADNLNKAIAYFEID